MEERISELLIVCTRIRNSAVLYLSIIDLYYSLLEEYQRKPEIGPPKIPKELNNSFIKWLTEELQTLDVVENGFNGGIQQFYFGSQDKLESIATILKIRTLLNQSISVLEIKISDLKAQVDKELEETRRKLEENARLSAEASEELSSEVLSSEQRASQIRDDKKTLLSLNKSIFIEYCRINHIPLDSTDIESINQTSFLKSFIRTRDPKFFIRTLLQTKRLSSKIKSHPVLINLISQYIEDDSQDKRESRSSPAMIDVGTDKETALYIADNVDKATKNLQSRGFSSQVVQRAITTSGTDLKKALQDTTEKGERNEIEIARKIRETLIEQLVLQEKDKTQLLEDIQSTTTLQTISTLETSNELVSRIQVTPTELTPSYFIEQMDNVSIIEAFGQSIDPSPDPSSFSDREPESRQTNTETKQPGSIVIGNLSVQKKTKRNLERIKTASQVLSKIAANPATLGVLAGGAAVGLTIYSFATNAIAGAFTGGGAIAGAIAGQLLIPIPFLGAGVGALIGSIGGNVVGWKVAGAVSQGSLSTTGITGGATTGLPNGMLSGGAKAVSIGASNAAAATLPSLSQSALITGGNIASSTLGATTKFLSLLPQAGSVFTSVPAAAALVGGPIVGAGVLSMIVVAAQYGTFLSDQTVGSTSVESPYVTVTKTASPLVMANSDLAANPKISYTISITPKVDPSTNLPYAITITSATDLFSITSKQTPPPAIPLDPQLSGGSTNPYTTSIPSTGKSFQYQIPVNDTYKDTRISNTFTADFTVTGQTSSQHMVASASVIIGNPPSDVFCVKFGEAGITWEDGSISSTSEVWPEDEKNRMIQALSAAAPYTKYLGLLCDKGDITLYRSNRTYEQGPTYGGFTATNGNVVYLYAAAVKDWGGGENSNMLNARYTIFHEFGHVLQKRHPEIMSSFLASVWGKESYLPTYPTGLPGTGTPVEDNAETFGVYMSFRQRPYAIGPDPKNPFVHFDMPTAAPIHYNWIKSTVFDNMNEPQ